MGRRTPIVMTPEVQPFTTDHTTIPQKARNFKAGPLGRAHIPLSPQQIENAQRLKNVSMEFATLGNTRCAPKGLGTGVATQLSVLAQHQPLLLPMDET